MKGNPAMKAKRVKGPTAQTLLCLHMHTQRCDHCNEPPVRSFTVDGMIKRQCIEHLNGKPRTEKRAACGRSWRPAWMS